MGRLTFVLSIALNAALASFLCVAVLATLFLDSGEEQIGWGLLWAFSVPGFLLFSLASLLVYPRYIAARSIARRLGVYVMVLAIVIASGYALPLAFAAATQP